MLSEKVDTHAAFTYGTLLKRCGIKTSTRRRAPADGTRHCMLSMFEVIFCYFYYKVFLRFHFVIAYAFLFFSFFGFIKTVTLAAFR